MTATNLGLGGNPVRLFGAYVVAVSTNLGLQQSPSTVNVTLVEDLNVTPQVLFTKPVMGQYVELNVGANYSFCGLVTKYEEDIRNISGRTISVDISDPREIMKSVPMVIAPGFRDVVSQIDLTGCSIIDAFGAFDDFDNTGVNLSGWNQAGMTYEKIALSLNGGSTNDAGFVFEVERQAVKGFGEIYRFDLTALNAKVDLFHRVNSNLISIADFIQELSDRYAFDWYVESSKAEDGIIDVVIKIIDRSTDNTDLSLDSFLESNDGKVVSARRGFELRNELACSIIYGAPVETLRTLNVLGLANNPIDLSEFGASSSYLMIENEMRVVLGNKVVWENWVKFNGDFSRYGSSLKAKSIISGNDDLDVKRQSGVQKDHQEETDEDRETKGKIFEALKGHAEASYGKRFLFTQVVDVDYIDAAWTADVVGGNNNPNEYFRNSQGKTRCYVGFTNANVVSQSITGAPSIYKTFGKGANAAQILVLNKGSFDIADFVTEADKADWIIKGSTLYMAATIEEGNIVRIDNPLIIGKPDDQEIQIEIEEATAAATNTTMLGGSRTTGQQVRQSRATQHGSDGAYTEISARTYQPTEIHLPVRSRFTRYGPRFASNMTLESQGAVHIENDDGFAPWEFGGTTLMFDAMQLKVDNAASQVKTVETAQVTIEGFPQFSIGKSLGLNSNINNISISFGGQVTTSYQLQSFLRKFGELSKLELAALSLFARRGGARVLPQDTVAFIERYRSQIARQFAGRGSASSSANNGSAGSFE